MLTGLGRAGNLSVTPEAMELAEIKLAPATARTVAEKLPLSGVIEAGGDRTARVTPRVGGKVVALYAVVGNTVRAGQTLGLIESRELAQAQAAYRQAQGRLSLSTSALARARKLARLGVYSQPQVEAGSREVVAAQGEANAVVGEVAQARSEVAEARSEESALDGDVAAARSGIAAARSEVARAQSTFAGAQRGVARAESAVAQARSEEAEAASEITEAQGQVKAQRAALTQSQTRAQTTGNRVARAETLSREGLVSGQDLETARGALAEAQADVDAAQANIAQAEAKVETARAHRQSAQAQIEAARAEVEAEKSQVGAARSQVNAASAGVSTAQAQARAAEGRRRGAGAKIQTAQARLAQVQLRLDSARRQVAIAQRSQARRAAVAQGGYENSKEIVEAEGAVSQAEIECVGAEESIRLLGGTPGGSSTLALVSPIAGRVQARDASPGETLDTEHAAFTIVNLDLVWARLAIAPRDASQVRVGQSVTISSESAPGRLFTGRVADLGTAADEATRGIPVRVAIANSSGALRPQTFVRGSVTTDVRQQRVTVPEGALQEHTNKPTVYVATGAPGAFEVRHVKLGVHGQGWREVSAGLKSGERIATGGTFYLKSEALKSSLSDGCCAVEKPAAPGGAA